MTDMGDAFAVARAIDGHLAQRDTDYADGVVEAFTEALYDYRGDGELDAFVERCWELLEEAGGSLNGEDADGRCFRAIDSVFSSG
ncbi:MAG: hypothetical protein FI703_00035 [SAR202 cluster bacterium]|jgi:hypothetical protein|nr:hypothetical protein [SAR202 cluster bacterium]